MSRLPAVSLTIFVERCSVHHCFEFQNNCTKTGIVWFSVALLWEQIGKMVPYATTESTIAQEVMFAI